MCNCRCVCRAWRMCARAPMSVWSHPGMLWLARLFGGASGMTLCKRRKIDGIGHRNAGGGCAARSVGRPRFYHGRGWPQGPWGSGLVFWFWFWFCFALASGVCFCFRWHPRIVSVLHASPLCGAAPTFLCRRKEK
ncbi:hypothetical protein [Paraburkholderia caribensis]|uniref:hypothetical protein n=3 Tax=Paraburkholderia caribensis TaxID=75105 RepID=UPI0034D27572